MNMKNEKRARESYSPWFVFIVAIFTTCLITANIIAVKMIRVFGLIVPAAIIIFPLSYLFGDVLTEVYGYSQARRVIWLGFLCNLLTVIAIWVAQVLPGASSGTLRARTNVYWATHPACSRPPFWHTLRESLQTPSSSRR